jgi:hypothetical protein
MPELNTRSPTLTRLPAMRIILQTYLAHVMSNIGAVIQAVMSTFSYWTCCRGESFCCDRYKRSTDSDIQADPFLRLSNITYIYTGYKL